MKKLLASVAMIALFTAGVSVAQAQDYDPGHPRINQLDSRENRQDQRIDNGLAKGTMTPAEAARDQAKDQKVDQEIQRDESKNGGHLTAAEQKHMNHQLNRNSRHIHAQKHNGVTPGGAPKAPAAAQ